MSVCLDAFAILCWLQDEPGADQVEERLAAAQRGNGETCYLSTINLGEVVYRLARVRGADEAKRFWNLAAHGELPLKLVDPTRRRIREAAFLKGTYRIAFADAFAIALAKETGTPLVTGDPEILAMHRQERVELVWLPDAR